RIAGKSEPHVLVDDLHVVRSDGWINRCHSIDDTLEFCPIPTDRVTDPTTDAGARSRTTTCCAIEVGGWNRISLRDPVRNGEAVAGESRRDRIGHDCVADAHLRPLLRLIEFPKKATAIDDAEN